MFSVAMSQIDQNINIKLSFRKRESNLFMFLSKKVCRVNKQGERDI